VFSGQSVSLGEAETMKITAISARLRKVTVDMEEMAARDGDLDFPDELRKVRHLLGKSDEDHRKLLLHMAQKMARR
jgi:hypothetical protein